MMTATQEKIKVTFDTQAAIRAQTEYCESHNYPMFAPEFDGTCFKCHNNIYKLISLEEAGSRLITGCPYCHYSFCE